MRWILSLALYLNTSTGALGAEIDKLTFMAGCWAGPFGDQVNQEMWMRPAAGTMMGLARNLKGDRTTFIEFTLINEENGVLGMTVQLKLAGEKTRFTVQRLRAGEVIFENPVHDFPQRILYRAQGKNRLFARVEGVAKGKAMSEEFPMKRVSCQ